MLHEGLREIAMPVAGPSDGKPFLVELGSSARETIQHARLFTWSTGEVMATVSPDGESVRLREVDETDAELVLTRDELVILDEVCQDWSGRRSTWWVFGHQGHWTDSGRYFYLVEPGGTGERLQVSKAWQGRENRTRLATPELIADGAERIVNLFRIGETVGPVDGAPVGCEYSLPGRLWAVARRSRLDLQRGDAKLSLWAGEEMLPQALLRALPPVV